MSECQNCQNCQNCQKMSSGAQSSAKRQLDLQMRQKGFGYGLSDVPGVVGRIKTITSVDLLVASDPRTQGSNDCL